LTAVELVTLLSTGQRAGVFTQRLAGGPRCAKKAPPLEHEVV
jgi:hypothetical protein